MDGHNYYMHHPQQQYSSYQNRDPYMSGRANSYDGQNYYHQNDYRRPQQQNIPPPRRQDTPPYPAKQEITIERLNTIIDQQLKIMPPIKITPAPTEDLQSYWD
ncbi:hypothetical protein TVAG_327600 [Trichomonas vaginalis G3]|uniref:Uncharacterized protein n=1 Tax=Trichomonas vaginalis (strain ATCC PRA-98 / G3) TaxID=412133 RepID=A2FRN1_TRIV3|nr:uncharacterized protein TVAGG3_1075620 [Trichomonas vaginalis G3]EAX92450.1 hypothetical protein TVAG_327600 [Trichomonas vaginalis G3]KAI5482957.1 hypothetical protein TVAGG3_1075620 [Trichomonas vaginalis G3]|eukprot:XP_001305380.1 hypothetical protein [Trichomonas vaginalis G3]